MEVELNNEQCDPWWQSAIEAQVSRSSDPAGRIGIDPVFRPSIGFIA